MTTDGVPGGPAGDTLVGVAAVEDYQQRMAAIARRAEATREQMAAIRPSATSPDGAVTVTVTGVGVLADLSFGPAARTLELPALAQLVLRTAREAHHTAAVRTQEALAGLVGGSSPALQFMRDFVPDEQDDATDATDTAGAAGVTGATPAAGTAGPAGSGESTVDQPGTAAPEPVRPAVRETPPARPPAPDTPDEDEGFTGRGLR